MEKNFWENSAYFCLALCIIGQITVGYLYLFAQTVYLISNTIFVVRDFVLVRPTADKIRDIAFLGITIALIILKLIIK